MKTLTLMLLVVLMLASGGCEKWFTTDVKYEVECDPPGFTVTYTTKNGVLVDQTITGNSWTKEIAIDDEVKEVWLFANSDSSLFSLNSITGRIYVEGTLEAERTSESIGIVMLTVEL